MANKGGPSLNFWSRVEITGSCWLWTGAGSKIGRGYGKTTFEGKLKGAHQVAWILTYGPIPPGYEICHTCDNPPCVRPDHLFLGTQKDNIQDMIRKRRGIIGEASGKAKLTTTEVVEIKQFLAAHMPIISIANKYQVCVSTIYYIKSGKLWNHS